MDVSVIVSVFSISRSNEVLNCLKSLEFQSLSPKEIIVVVDPDIELINYYESKLPPFVKLVISKKRGLSNARNEGIKSSTSDIVAFIDDDAIAEVDWLRNLIKNYDDPQVVSVGGYIEPKWEGKRPKWFPRELDWIVGCSYKGLPERREYVRNAIGCNMSFRKKIFYEVGFFRTDVGRFGKHLLGSEEPELSNRILSAIPNSKIIYEPNAVVHHSVARFRQKINYIWRRSYYEGLSKAILISSQKKSGKKLSTENEYIKYLIGWAIPSRLKKFYKLRNLAQLMTIFISTFAVFLGFATGKLLRY
ncbi:glycosyltransferase [Candidatus Bathyarchaeota archaeon]|nr:glycosyltransferase [Candidatus Bathyarchaeota archaeon]